MGEDTIISEKTTIKNCSIGSNCIVEPKVRLTNCILMDKVIVKSGSNVHGSLVCDNVTIEEKCDVKECIVGSGVQVENEGKIFYIIYKVFHTNSGRHRYISIMLVSMSYIFSLIGEHRNEVLATDDSEMMEI